jgi:hypothetical protein
MKEDNMKLVIVKRTIVLLLGVVAFAVFLMSISYTFNPIVQTFKNSRGYQKAERQVLKKYQALDGKLEFALPETWTTMEEAFNGGEIEYNLYFQSPDKNIHGFVQTWNIDKPLKQFVEESKESAVGVVDFKYYRIKEIMVDNKKGYLLDYSRRTDQDEYIKAYEAFLQGYDGRIARVSFFVNEKNWRPQYLILFNRIIRSFVIMK